MFFEMVLAIFVLYIILKGIRVTFIKLGRFIFFISESRTLSIIFIVIYNFIMLLIMLGFNISNIYVNGISDLVEGSILFFAFTTFILLIGMNIIFKLAGIDPEYLIYNIRHNFKY